MKLGMVPDGVETELKGEQLIRLTGSNSEWAVEDITSSVRSVDGVGTATPIEDATTDELVIRLRMDRRRVHPAKRRNHSAWRGSLGPEKGRHIVPTLYTIDASTYGPCRES